MTNATHQDSHPGVFRLFLFVLAFMIPMSPGYASSSPAQTDSVHFCLPLNFEEMQARDSIFAANKQALNLNVGPPRTVRMIYFLPNDRPYRPDVVQQMKDEIGKIQTLYAAQMEANGYGKRTFRVETDSHGEPLVHRLDGRYSDTHYLETTFLNVFRDIEQAFDLKSNVFFIIVDNSTNTISTGRGGGGGRWNKISGFSLLTVGSLSYGAHELGHAFGLDHDFRDDSFFMSYGEGSRGTDYGRLSACHARYLSVHPHFNSDISIEGDSESGSDELFGANPRPIHVISPREYPAGSTIVPIRLQIVDSEGLNQVIIKVKTLDPFSAAGHPEVKSCRAFKGERETVLEFGYDGVIPSDSGTSLSNPARHEISVDAVDIDGNVRSVSFWLIEIPRSLIATLEQDSPFSISFSPNGELLAVGANGGALKLWNVSTQSNIATLLPCRGVAFSPNGRLLVAGGTAFENGEHHGAIRIWDVRTKELNATLRHGLPPVSSVDVSPEGTTIASGSSFDGLGNASSSIKLWNVKTKQSIATFGGNRSPINSVRFSPDGRTLASGGLEGGKIKLWDVIGKKQIATLSETHIFDIACLVFSPDGTLLVSGSGSGKTDSLLNLWDMVARKHVATLRTTSGVGGVAFSPDGTMIASGEQNGRINLWDVPNREVITTISGHTAGISSVAFSPDGRVVASASDRNNEIRLWDTSALGIGVSSAAAFSLSLDGDIDAGDQHVDTLDVSAGSTVPIQVFANDVRGANGISMRFEYAEAQLTYQGFDAGSLLPSAQVLPQHHKNPTAVEISVVSFGGQAAADSGLVGTARFSTTDMLSETTLRLVSAEIGRGDQRESVTLSDTAVILRLAQLTPDFNGDGRVDFGDFVALGMHFGAIRGDARYDAKYDLDQDGTIGFGDFLIFGQEFGSGA